jgi:hypothetical protein
MKTRSHQLIGIAGLLLSGFAMYAASPVHTEHPSSSPDQKAASGMMGVPSASKDSMQSADPLMGEMDMTGMMKKMGMNPAMMAQGKMMMHATIDQGDPAAMLGLTAKLDLTPKQQAALKKIAADARTAAHQVLTDAQRSVLKEIPAGPSSMAQMHATMMEHMHAMSSGDGGHDMPTACPMMSMMMSGDAEPAPVSGDSATGDHASHTGH